MFTCCLFWYRPTIGLSGIGDGRLKRQPVKQYRQTKEVNTTKRKIEKLSNGDDDACM